MLASGSRVRNGLEVSLRKGWADTGPLVHRANVSGKVNEAVPVGWPPAGFHSCQGGNPQLPVANVFLFWGC